MPRYTAEGDGGYPAAKALKAAFNQAGIESDFTRGGLWVEPNPGQIESACSIAKEYKWKVLGGATSSTMIDMKDMTIKSGGRGWGAVHQMHVQAVKSQEAINRLDVDSNG